MTFPVYQAKEWQCRYVFPDQKCCGLPLNHEGDHQPAEDKRLYPRASPLSRALREIAKGKKLSSLQVPVLEDAASHIEDLEDRLRELANTVEQVMPDMFPDQQAVVREALATARKW